MRTRMGLLLFKYCFGVDGGIGVDFGIDAYAGVNVSFRINAQS